MISRSTFCDAGPFSMTVHTDPGRGGSAARFTNRDAGSTSTDHTSLNALSFCRFFSVTVTGPEGQGSRIDSWNVRAVVLTSGVVSHSP